jgi:beta-glucanase (GH16 family)
MTTSSSSNSYIQNSQLYINPTLTTLSAGLTNEQIFNGANYTLSDCTTTNQSACTVSSSYSTGTVINPVMSARLSTMGKKNIQYGKVEVKAKLPSG